MERMRSGCRTDKSFGREPLQRHSRTKQHAERDNGRRHCEGAVRCEMRGCGTTMGKTEDWESRRMEGASLAVGERVKRSEGNRRREWRSSRERDLGHFELGRLKKGSCCTPEGVFVIDRILPQQPASYRNTVWKREVSGLRGTAVD